MIHPLHFEKEIVRPTLFTLAAFDKRLYSEASVKLMMGTAAQESDLGFFLRQHPRGPGKGFWSVEDATHDDVWRYLERATKAELKSLVFKLTRFKQKPPGHELIRNPMYCAAIARIRYWYEVEPLPQDLVGLARYWDEHYNANPNHGTPEEFLDSYQKFVLRNKHQVQN